MKKIFLSILLLVAAFMASAQERSTHFVLDFSSGCSNFYNYSGLSKISYNKANNFGGFTQADIGIIRHGKVGIFLDMELNNIDMRYSNVLNEKVFLAYGGLSLSFIGKVSDKISIEPRIGGGILSSSNKIHDNNNTYTMNRIGQGCKMSLLLTYKLSEHLACGINGEFFLGNLKDEDLPKDLAAYSTNSNNNIYSGSLSLVLRATF